MLSSSEKKKDNTYIDLKINGKLFPSWVLSNFKKYKLDEIVKTIDDPCNTTVTEDTDVKKLYKYQEFLGMYLSFKSPFHDVLLYHGLGSGKTASAINISYVLFSKTQNWNIFLLIKASLRGSWLNEFKQFIPSSMFDTFFKNVYFIHYDSPFADRDFMDAIKIRNVNFKTMFIFDEVHNFIRNVYGNVSSNKAGKRAKIIYDYIIQFKKDNIDTRTILISATPAINVPFELGLLFNLLRPGIFPSSEADFNNMFVSQTGYKALNPDKKNMFQRRILGLVSFYHGSTPAFFAAKETNNIDIPMSSYQTTIYDMMEDLEDKIAMQSFNSKSYKSYTRPACNFVFPYISQTINGEGRPRPGKFRISEKEALKLLEGSDGVDMEKVKNDNLLKYFDAMNAYIIEFDNYLNSKHQQDIKNNHTIINDITDFVNFEGHNFMDFHMDKTKKKSELYNVMVECSLKMVAIIFNIMISPGPTIVYSNYVLMEGLQTFKIYLKYFGFYNFMDTKQLDRSRVGYVEFHGSIKNWEDRYAGMEEFNKSDNKQGTYIKIMLISAAGAEGLNLRNVRQVHIMEPYWNETRIIQMIGRAIRLCSHKELPKLERVVRVFRYNSVRVDNPRLTADQFVEETAKVKEGLISSFLEAMKEAAIDCELNKNHNKLAHSYKCFQFDEPSLLSSNIGPAYKIDITDDAKTSSGLNSTNSKVVRVKAVKIKAVVSITKPNEAERYGPVAEYWYDKLTGHVYDPELYYLTGSIKIDSTGIPVKLDENTYIIDKVVPIPTFNYN